MSVLDEYHDRIIEQKLNRNGNGIPPESAGHSLFDFIIPVIRRWYITFPVFLAMCLIGIPMIWLVKTPLYNVAGAIRVAPILMSILSGKADKGDISNYQSFMNTQAKMVTSNQVIQRVADNLVDKNLSFFENYKPDIITQVKEALSKTRSKPEIAGILKQAISKGDIKAATSRNTELITVTMVGENPENAKQIIDAFIRAYMAVEVSSSTQNEDRKLNVLENERMVLTEKMQRQREEILQLAKEYGSTALGGRHDMKLERVASLLAELTKLEANRIHLEAKVQLLEQTKEKQNIDTTELLQMRNEYMNSDHAINTLVADIARLEEELIVARQRLTEGNPELALKVELIETLNEHLRKLKNEAGENFDKLVAGENTRINNEKLSSVQAELELVIVFKQQFEDMLAREDEEVIELGRKQLTIEDMQDQLELTKETYDTVRRRIQELAMERKRPARISVAYNADVVSIEDKRIKLILALIFGAMACGAGLAFVRDKIDKSLRTPKDIMKNTGMRVIGTTVDWGRFEKSHLPERLREDYQAIYANLGLLNSNGGRMPRTLVVTSAKPREGKTTFAINLASSISKSGKKVLLIEGDLRKPDIGKLLGAEKHSKGLQDLINGESFQDVVCHVPSVGMDVLTADCRNTTQVYEIITAIVEGEYINKIAKRYDNIIIDTPPVLMFPDTLMWTKVADAVVLACFAGQTTTTVLKEANHRLSEINIKALGAILSNVRLGYSYYHYGHDYYKKEGFLRSNRKRNKVESFLIPMHRPGNDVPKSNH